MVGAALGAAAAGLSMVSTIFGGLAQRKAARAKAEVMERNVDLANYQASDALGRGDVAAKIRRQQAQQTAGEQRTALAAQGIDVNSGTAADIQGNTTYLGELDAQTIRNNAAREAWGYQVQAQDYQIGADFTRAEGDNEMISTLLTGANNLILAGAGFGRGLTSDYPLLPTR